MGKIYRVDLSMRQVYNVYIEANSAEEAKEVAEEALNCGYGELEDPQGGVIVSVEDVQELDVAPTHTNIYKVLP